MYDCRGRIVYSKWLPEQVVEGSPKKAVMPRGSFMDALSKLLRQVVSPGCLFVPVVIPRVPSFPALSEEWFDLSQIPQQQYRR